VHEVGDQTKVTFPQQLFLRLYTEFYENLTNSLVADIVTEGQTDGQNAAISTSGILYPLRQEILNPAVIFAGILETKV